MTPFSLLMTPFIVNPFCKGPKVFLDLSHNFSYNFDVIDLHLFISKK